MGIEDSPKLEGAPGRDKERESRFRERKVFETKAPVKIADAIASETFSTAQSIILNQLRSVLALPIFTNEKIIGVLYLDHRHQPHVFDKLNLSLLEAFADQVGIALSRKK